MNRKELIEKSLEDNCFDNPTLDENDNKTTVIYVKSRLSDNESALECEQVRDTAIYDQHTDPVPRDAPIRPAINADYSDDESSSDSIEIICIKDSSPKTPTTEERPQPSIEIRTEIHSSEPSTKKDTKKQSKEELYRTVSMNIFEDTHIFWKLIESTNTGINVINPMEDLIKFLFSPPPKDVVVTCQLNKTNRKDKTNLFTKYIFSLQISQRHENDRRELFTLMAARCRKKTKTINYVISTDPSDMKAHSPSNIGKVRGNLLGTQFRFYQYKRPVSANSFDNVEYENSQDNISEVESNCSNTANLQADAIGIAFYKPISLSKQKPRRTDVVIPYWNDSTSRYCSDQPLPNDRNELTDDSNTHVLETLEPKFNKILKCYTLDFGGRAKKTSVKNFALTMKVEDKPKRVFQFGKCKDHYIVDYTFPLCAFQAFALGLGSCHRKLISD